MLQPDEALVFLHLPKTAGFAIRNALRRHFTDRGDGAAMFDGRDQNLASASWNVRLVAGHFSYGLHWRLRRRCRYVTVVREPIERALSHYAQHLRNLAAGLSAPTLDEWMDRFPLQAFNLQTRWLCRGPGQTYGELCREGDAPAMDDGHLHDAQRNLATFGVVGTFEALDLFVGKLSAFCGGALDVRLENVYPRLTVADLTLGQLERLVEGNALDSELWRFAHGR